MYVIMGATGNVGSAITERLLASGQKVRIIARDENKLRMFVDRGAEAHTGSVQNAAFLTEAFEGAKAVFTMIPADIRSENPAQHEDNIGEAVTLALQRSRVPHVVNLSSLGGEIPSGTGPIAGLHRQEERLNMLPANILHLRPTYYMENEYAMIPMIKNMGIMGSSLRGDLSLPMVATQDVGEAAAQALQNLNFEGKNVRLVLGQRDLTMVEVAHILGAAIGKPDLPYIHFSYEDAEKGMIAAGISENVAKSYNEMNKALNDGLIRSTRTKENTTPTSIEEFAKRFAAVYNM